MNNTLSKIASEKIEYLDMIQDSINIVGEYSEEVALRYVQETNVVVDHLNSLPTLYTELKNVIKFYEKLEEAKTLNSKVETIKDLLVYNMILDGLPEDDREYLLEEEDENLTNAKKVLDELADLEKDELLKFIYILVGGYDGE